MTHIFVPIMSITVPVVPVPQPRQRHAMIGGHVRNYTPTGHPVNVFKAAMQLAVAEQLKVPIEGPIMLEADFFLPRTKAQMRSRWEGPIPHTARPDTDNLVKALKDALKGIAWRDDSQVFQYRQIGKYYCDKTGQPRVRLCLYGAADMQTAKGA